ncbi:hypothetical protein PHLCEN_2v1881 [Hermanssonia centrifuga]|uniref:Uncharacterized protein n=1 Tax=Hermanssonia centrifuga TaxID=98765 RepID=A0A2R6RVN7_9APHY|nr:hypothetical protein PHLCEN_2v1881 [Hermanssonia centrifuga]
MITVPALGPEWKASELRDMTKRGRREDAADRRAQKWKEWRRGERGLVGIVLAFTVPRVPGFQINQDNPLTNATGAFNKSIPVEFPRAPTNFSFPALADLQIDTSSNFLPLKFNSLHADVFDLQTSRQVGSGDLGSMTFPAKQFTQISIPLNFSYIATNDSDTTWNNWYNACRNSAFAPSGKRPPVQFRLVLGFDIAGLIGTKHAATDVTTANCPVELPQSAP